jgi:hypothetical protein
MKSDIEKTIDARAATALDDFFLTLEPMPEAPCSGVLAIW